MTTTASSWRNWQQEGSLFLWRYDPSPGSLRGWHLTADARGCDSIRDLIDLFALVNDQPAKRTLTLSTPTAQILAVPGNYSGRRFVSPRKLVIQFDPAAARDDWLLSENEECLEVALGRDRLSELSAALENVKLGSGDFSIGLKHALVWFWWMPGTFSKM